MLVKQGECLLADSLNSESQIPNPHQGFTLIEILMVMILVAILVTVGVTQFTNFSAESRTNTLRSNLQILRNAIGTQNGQMRQIARARGLAVAARLLQLALGCGELFVLAGAHGGVTAGSRHCREQGQKLKPE